MNIEIHQSDDYKIAEVNSEEILINNSEELGVEKLSK